MKETRVRFPSGKLSLEGILWVPDGIGPFPAVVVCHPHPLYGGSMDNNVVDALCAALTQASLAAFKFNFRGVGGSEGEYSGGKGEQEDVSAAISFVVERGEVDRQRPGLAGYSAGAGFGFPAGIADARVKALAGVAPPLSMFDFEPLRTCLKPKLLVCGTEDEFIPVTQFKGFCQKLPEPKQCVIIDGADHFWWGFESLLASKVVTFFEQALKGSTVR